MIVNRITSLCVLFLVLHLMVSKTSAMILTEEAAKAGFLEKKVENIFKEIHTLPLSISKKGIQVWTKWEGSKMLTISEAKHVLYHPNEFRTFLASFSENFPKVNQMCEKTSILHQEGVVRKGVKSKLKFPFPFSDRLMIHWQYTRLDKDQDEHLIMLSEDGNGELLDKFHTAEEKKRYVLGRTFLCAYWIKPVYDEDGERRIIGSNIRYMFSGDTGGSIPKYVQDMVGPKTAFDSVEGLIKFVQRKNKGFIDKYDPTSHGSN